MIPKSTQMMAAMVVNHMRHEWLKNGGDYREKVLELANDFERRGDNHYGEDRETYETCAKALRRELQR